MADALDELRKLLDPKRLPRRGEYLIHDGEIYWFFATGNREEEGVRKLLYD
jgi:hypothetical protein